VRRGRITGRWERAVQGAEHGVWLAQSLVLNEAAGLTGVAVVVNRSGDEQAVADAASDHASPRSAIRRR
jgi:hypothetical protein